MSRREFLIATTGAAVGLAALGLGCAKDGLAGGEDGGLVDAAMGGPGPGDLAGTDLSVPAGSTSVGLAGAGSIDEKVRRAVELAGGIDEIRAGQTVFIKPNAVHSLTGGRLAIVTSNEVLAAVIKLVRERNPGRIIVGDRCARGFNSNEVLDSTGMREAAMAAGATEVYGAPTPKEAPGDWVLLQPPRYEETWAVPGGILAMRKIVEADHFINVPVCKDHRWAVYSMTMKNLIGAVGDSSRDLMHYTATKPERLSRDVAILNQMFHPLINIVDARAVLLNGGPEGVGADAVRTTPGLIIAGKDRVAVDATGVSLIKLGLTRETVKLPDEANPFLVSRGPWQMPQALEGIDRGLSVGSAAKVVLRFDGVADAAGIEGIFRA